ncbi:MAG: hypothetical protein AMXMBFR7_09110 [Planctomycetota bacterium]
MKRMLTQFLVICSVAMLAACSSQEAAPPRAEAPAEVAKTEAPAADTPKKESADVAQKNDPAADPEWAKWRAITDEEWKKRLTPKQYEVLRTHGTERACTGAYWNEKRAGTYVCAGCDLPLFTSGTKFDSKTGWPSFFQPVNAKHVEQDVDYKLGYARNEVHCARCKGHLGHVFTDGPQPTGLRYCINSVSVKLVPEGAKTGEAVGEGKKSE